MPARLRRLNRDRKPFSKKGNRYLVRGKSEKHIGATWIHKSRKNRWKSRAPKTIKAHKKKQYPNTFGDSRVTPIYNILKRKTTCVQN